MFTFFFPSILGNKSLATTSSTSQPRFISQGHTYRAVVGETLTLPCEVENIGTSQTTSLERSLKENREISLIT